MELAFGFCGDCSMESTSFFSRGAWFLRGFDDDDFKLSFFFSDFFLDFFDFGAA